MADFDARMATLRGRFLAQTANEATLLADHAQAGRWAEVGSLCHGLAGRAGMFGFGALGDAARDLEEAIDAKASVGDLTLLVDRVRDEAMATRTA